MSLSETQKKNKIMLKSLNYINIRLFGIAQEFMFDINLHLCTAFTVINQINIVN